MTNYTHFPRHRYQPGTCVICFSYSKYSWTPISRSQLKYLKTNYCGDDSTIFVKGFNHRSYKLSASDFRKCITDDFLFNFDMASQLTLENSCESVEIPSPIGYNE